MAAVTDKSNVGTLIVWPRVYRKKDLPPSLDKVMCIMAQFQEVDATADASASWQNNKYHAFIARSNIPYWYWGEVIHPDPEQEPDPAAPYITPWDLQADYKETDGKELRKGIQRNTNVILVSPALFNKIFPRHPETTPGATLTCHRLSKVEVETSYAKVAPKVVAPKEEEYECETLSVSGEDGALEDGSLKDGSLKLEGLEARASGSSSSGSEAGPPRTEAKRGATR